MRLGKPNYTEPRRDFHRDAQRNTFLRDVMRKIKSNLKNLRDFASWREVGPSFKGVDLAA